MESTLCLECRHPMEVPEFYMGRSIKCSACGQNFVAYPLALARKGKGVILAEEEKARRDAAEAERLRLEEAARVEQARIDALNAVLDAIQRAAGRHYIELDPADRDLIESMLASLLSRPLSSLDKLQASVVRKGVEICGRTEYLSQAHARKSELVLDQMQVLLARLVDQSRRNGVCLEAINENIIHVANVTARAAEIASGPGVLISQEI